MKKKFRKDMVLTINCNTEDEANQVTKIIEEFVDKKLNTKNHNYNIRTTESPLTNVAEREAYLAIGTK